MSIHLFDCPIAGAPSEPMARQEATVRPIKDSERECFHEELSPKHHLQNARAHLRVFRAGSAVRGRSEINRGGER